MPSSPVVELSCLRQVVEGGSRRFPVYVGFATPSDLVRVASAPAFARDAAHREIANRVLEPPVSDWQRPLDLGRVGEIAAAFSSADALMPNPVLLSENIDAGMVEPEVVLSSNGTPTEVWRLKLSVPASDREEPPLWILDGQHRINGLAASARSDVAIPVVLLLNSGQAVYTGRDFALIFAQVTVTAKGLDPLHQEWLTYSYDLGDYRSDLGDAESHRASFEAAAYLCGSSSFDDQPNSWLNGVVFNPEPEAKAGTALQGFRYNVVELKNIIKRYYFDEASASGVVLDPEEIASQMSTAYGALRQMVREPQAESVFFGKGTTGHKVMQDGYLAGVLTRLARVGAPHSWLDLLTGLRFAETDWNFKWAATRGGNAGNTSRKLAETVLSNLLTSGELPHGTDNAADFLAGNNAEVVVVCRHVKASGQPSSDDPLIIKLMRGNKVSRDIGERRHVKVLKPGHVYGGSQTTINIGKIEAYDGSKVGKPLKYAQLTGAGMLMSDAVGDHELSVLLNLEHYGAESSQSSLTLRWS